MELQILRGRPGDEFATPERCLIVELLNRPEDGSVSLARARVPPGVTTQRHRLVGVDERYVITEGEGEVEVGRRGRERVGAGDIVVIPSGTPQRITNVGPGDLVFYCVCTPRFRPDCYEVVEPE